MESYDNKDVVHYISRLGKGVKTLFKSSLKAENRKLVSDPEPESSHRLSFGEVYANDLAKTEIEKDIPKFPVGSIIVREKNLSPTSEIPETVIAMVKRENGFSEASGDWEFFVFDGKDLLVKQRETTGSCATCHSSAKDSDWVFRDYLK